MNFKNMNLRYIFPKKYSFFTFIVLGLIAFLISIGSVYAPAKARTYVNSHRSCEVSIQSNELQTEDISNFANQREGIILDYKVDESSLYTDESNPQFRNRVDAIIAPYLGEMVSSANLTAIQDEITLLYLRDGYVTSRAENLSIRNDGILVVKVIEGFICEVSVRSQDNSLFSAAEMTPLGRLVLSYLEPILRNSDGTPKRPINLSQVERRIRALSRDERFEPGQLMSRLQVPVENFLDRYIRLSPLLSQVGQPEQGQTSSVFQTLLETDRSDIAAPGASILEISVEVKKEVVEDSDEDSSSDDLSRVRLNSSIPALENRRLNEFRGYFGRSFDRQMVDPAAIRFALHSLELQEPAIRAAVVYVASDRERVFIRVETSQGRTIEIEDITQFEREAPDDEFTFDSNRGGQVSRRREESEENTASPENTSQLKPGKTVERDELVEQVENLWKEIQKPNSDNYLRSSAQLYDLLIRPVEQELEAQEIEVNTLLFVMENGLRFLPAAALYDSETNKYLAEKYKISVIPNFRSLDLRPADLTQADVLAMGISEFSESDTYAPLSAVPLELELLDRTWRHSSGSSKIFRNESSTLVNLRNARREHPFQIIHLATHANFRPGKPGDSSIQLWDTPLPLNELQVATLNWNKPPVDLLVLSACQTALGDEAAELGFAGLSLQAEVKSILASLWYVNDLASLIYMMEFYRNLAAGVTKAEAVQNTQMAMLDKQRLTQNLRELKIVINSLLADSRRFESLTETETQGLEKIYRQLNEEDKIAEVAEQFTHPFYWSAYTLVGSPW